MAAQAPRSFWQRAKMLAPFLWPRGDRFLQLRVVCCLALLGVIRLVTVGVPVIYKRLIDHLTKSADVARGIVTSFVRSLRMTRRLL
jgi:ATP-binding cassette, subfamily B, heavy metal transporter